MSFSKIVVIPVYKEIPNDIESYSLINNIKVLENHKISILTYKELDISYYIKLLNSEKLDYQIDLFDKSFFSDVESYSKLLLSRMFYKNFINYDFMLITQLDVYVFRDELDNWCNKEFDYIGAPWFEFFRDSRTKQLKAVGNGGFSLRKTQSYINAIDYVNKHSKKKISLFNTWNQFMLFGKSKKLTFIQLIKKIGRKLLGLENNLNYYFNSNIYEDIIWSLIIPEAIKTFKVAPIKDAYEFSFESDPSYLFELNNKKLPFGCHAWHKNQYEEFWSKFIQIDKL